MSASDLQPQPIRHRVTRHWDARQLMLARRLVLGLLLLLLFFIFHPVYVYIVEHRDFTTCQDNMRKIQRGIWTYASDFDDTLPVGSTWMDSVAGYATGRSGTGQSVGDIFHCPLDKSSAPSSYVYNDLLSGLTIGSQVQSTDPAAEKRRRSIAHFDRVPLVIEKHGSDRNAHMMLRTWDDVSTNLSKPHQVPDRTGTILFGNGITSSRDAETLSELQGRRF